MRLFTFLLVSFLAQALAAQSGRSPFEEREYMEHDTVRVVETYLVKKDRLMSRKRYVGERPVGLWQEYDDKGRLITERDFGAVRYITLPKQEAAANVRDSPQETHVEEMPMFPGGEAELFKFLAKNIRYPPEAQDAGVSGVVYLTGVVDDSGTWTTKGIAKGAHPYLDYEAWRVLSLMPRWTPGKVDGVPVNVQYNLPIKFTLR